MLSKSSTQTFIALATASLLGACAAPPPIDPSETAKSAAELAAESATCDPKLYPCGPFGYQIGDVAPNLSFVGRRVPQQKSSSSTISLSDFYQDKSVKVIALLVAAEWCGPCQEEQGELVDAWNNYQANKSGVAFVEALTQSTDYTPADLATVDRWSGRMWTNYGVNPMTTGKIITFPLVADPAQQVVPLGLTGYPTQILIQTSDMTIQWLNTGYSSGALEGTIMLDFGI